MGKLWRQTRTFPVWEDVGGGGMVDCAAEGEAPQLRVGSVCTWPLPSYAVSVRLFGRAAGGSVHAGPGLPQAREKEPLPRCNAVRVRDVSPTFSAVAGALPYGQ